MNKRWKIKNKKHLLPAASNQRVDEIVRLLLKNRQLKTKKQQEEFFNPRKPWDEKVIKEIGISQKELTKAVKRIKKAVKNKELIVVYGDYDADGICGTAILWETLYSLKANAMPFIPHREKHGYGLSKKGIDDILNNEAMKQLKNGSMLIITVDNGIVAHEAAKYANSKGIDVIITDHHQKKVKSKKLKVKSYSLPKAQAIVWSDKVCGAVVAWVLAKEILDKSRNLKAPILIREFLDLAAIGTVADMIPLLGPNRSIVKYGLEQLNKTERIGLIAMFEEAGLKKGEIANWQLGFVISPRINAMGRLVSALDSLRLLCTKDKKRAKNLAQTLGTVNKERQELTLSTLKQAEEMSTRRLADKTKKLKILVIAHESFNPGIIGLVAGRLVERFYKPAIVISKGEEFCKASVRSISGFNIIEYLRSFEDFFEDLGGHPMAAGFTVKTSSLVKFQEKVESEAQKQISGELLKPVLEADCEIKLDDIKPALYNQIKNFAPFGIGNPQPSFITKAVEIVSFRQVGREGKHLKLTLRHPDPEPCRGRRIPINAIAFNKGNFALKLKSNQKIDLLYNIDENNWNSKKDLQLKVKDIKI